MSSVRKYYEGKESRIGYKLFLRGAQHFGLWPENLDEDYNEKKAQQIHHDFLYKNLSVEEGSKVLDIGCGRGVVANDLADRYRLNITGIDLTPYIVEEARTNSSRLGEYIRPNFIQGSYQELPFEENSFDALYAVETLSHATDLEKAITEAKRVVKPGGRCVFFEYMIDTKVPLSDAEERYYKLVRDESAMFSLDRFKDNGFLTILEDSGLSDISVQDVSKMAERSFSRLHKYAQIPYMFIKALKLEAKFVNTTAGVEYFKLAKRGYLNYFIYTGNA